MLTTMQKMLGALLLFCLMAVGVIGFYGWILSNLTAGEETLPDRLGSETEWDPIRTHLYCEVLTTGQDRSTVENGLLELGYFKTREVGDSIEISFEEQALHLFLGQIMLRYDTSDRLMERMIFDLTGDLVRWDC